MYTLDINLLSHRTEYQIGKQTSFGNTTTIARSNYSKVPLYIGAGVAVCCLLMAGGGWLWTGQQTAQLEQKQKDLDQKLGSLKVQEQRLQAVNEQVNQITGESQSLASVFDQIQPWSAILQDLRENIPQGVQIANVAQSEIKSTAPVAAPAPAPSNGGLINKISTPPNPEASPTPAPTAGASPAPTAATPATAPVPVVKSSIPLPADVPTTKLDITGTAKSFDEVNNFILTLKQSSFFNPDDTQLLSTSITNPLALTKLVPPIGKAEISTAQQQQLDRLNRLELPKIVDYRIQTSLKHVPSADLIRELERKGAVGLVARLRTLQQQQTIKP